MNEIAIIKYLLEEIEEEQKYNAEYKKAEKEAMEKAKKESKEPYAYLQYYRFMPEQFKHRSPRKSIIKANAIKIRQLSLKIFRG